MLLLALALPTIHAQEPTTAGEDIAVTHLPKAVLQDQVGLWTSPTRLRARDLTWLLPLAGSVGWLLTSDERNMRERIRTNLLARDRSVAVSNVGTGSLAAVPALLYWWGWRRGDEYAQHTAILSARAAADALIAGEILHAATWRQRPMEGTGAGRFFAAKSLSSSFPSLHPSAAWAIASVLARRYPGWLTQVGVYGLATAVSLSRVTARQHYPSEVVVGSALGLLIGRFVSRDTRTPVQPSSESAKPETGATYVPMDSWIYAALDRLGALGLVPSQISGLRPWTRAECRRPWRSLAAWPAAAESAAC